MRDLSMHILDIVRNSVEGSANLIKLTIIETDEKIEIKVIDDGRGINQELLKDVANPFYTSRTTRKIGLGLSMFKATTERTGGSFKVKSSVNIGTEVFAELNLKHIDCPPLGDINETVMTIIMDCHNYDFIYNHKKNNKEFTLNTIEIKGVLDGIPIYNSDVLEWIKEQLPVQI